jgi:hypothetical protein
VPAVTVFVGAQLSKENSKEVIHPTTVRILIYACYCTRTAIRSTELCCHSSLKQQLLLLLLLQQ